MGAGNSAGNSASGLSRKAACHEAGGTDALVVGMRAHADLLAMQEAACGVRRAAQRFLGHRWQAGRRAQQGGQRVGRLPRRYRSHARASDRARRPGDGVRRGLLDRLGL
jgi:hypothetical protein